LDRISGFAGLTGFWPLFYMPNGFQNLIAHECILPFQGARGGGGQFTQGGAIGLGYIALSGRTTPFGGLYQGFLPSAMRSWKYMPDIPPCNIHFSLQPDGLKVQHIPAQRHRLG
jgi:hypothetical protein